MKIFKNRKGAGERLAKQLQKHVRRSNTVILVLPRGGSVPVAFEVAKSFRLPLDVFLVRKLGVPGQEELAHGRYCF